MSTDFKCNDGNEHDFDSNTESEYCAKGCGEKWAIYAIKKLGADLKEKDAAVEQLKAEIEQLKAEIKKLVEINDRALSSAPFQEIAALKSKLAKAKEALKRYADPETKCFVSADYESIARQALKEIGEG